LSKYYLVQVAFLLSMEKVIKQKNKPRKSSKHTRQLSKLKRKFIEYYAKLPIQKLAAEYIGKSEDTICDWKNNDKDFANQIASTKSAWALENVGKVKSTEWLLERVMHDHFGEKKDKEDDERSKRLDGFMDRMAKMLP